MNQPRRVRDSERTRRLLLTAAEELFAERGVAGASTDEIAKRSGVNKAMISYHFGGKEQLYAAIVEENVGRAVPLLEELIPADLSAQDKLRQFIRIFAQMHIEKASLSVILLRELLAGGPLIDSVFREKLFRVFRVMGEILKQGERERTLRKVSPVEAHTSMIGALLFYFATRSVRERMEAAGKLPPSGVTPESYVAYLEDLMTRGLAPDPTPRRASTAEARSPRRNAPKKPRGNPPTKTASRRRTS